MYINKYEYLVPTIDCGDHKEIEGIARDGYTTHQYLNRISPITLDRPTAILYASGTVIHQSEGRDVGLNNRFKGSVEQNTSSTVIKESSAYCMHKWISTMQGKEHIVYANVNGNTCASSMYSLFEAEMLLDNRVCEQVVIIAEERTSFNTIRIFKEHRIPLTVSDGLAVMVLSRDVPSKKVITHTQWDYLYHNNPFMTTKEGYDKVLTEGCDNVKPHGTGTITNNKAEESLIKHKNVINYKREIGHTQGVSALLEICMLLDDKRVKGSTLCIASGLGGFYGSCMVYK